MGKEEKNEPKSKSVHSRHDARSLERILSRVRRMNSTQVKCDRKVERERQKLNGARR